MCNLGLDSNFESVQNRVHNWHEMLLPNNYFHRGSSGNHIEKNFSLVLNLLEPSQSADIFISKWL